MAKMCTTKENKILLAIFEHATNVNIGQEH